MKVLIDIGHPAHVHLFKHFAWLMQDKGHEIFFTCRDKEFEIYLLKKYGFLFKSFGRKYVSKIGKIWGLINFDIKELLTGLKFKPDIFLSHGSIYAAHAAYLLRTPNIALEDTFNFEQLRLSLPFYDVVLTSDYDHPLIFNKKNVSYAGYHELAYLHPNRFRPDKKILSELGVNEGEKYVVMRFVAWQASHDFGNKGFSLENQFRAVREFEKHARVFISSESKLPDELLQYKIPVKPDRMHDAIAYATLLFGESSTMAEEAAMLGVPAIYLSSISTHYTNHLENKYGLVVNFSNSLEDQSLAIAKGLDLLTHTGVKLDWQKCRDRLLSERIDVTAFMVWFVENFPDSIRIMKQDPSYQQRFK